MKYFVIPFLLLALVVLIGCTNNDVNYESLITNGDELRPSEPLAMASGDIYLPQSFGWKVTEGRESLVEFTVISITRIDGVHQGWGGDYHYSFILHIDDVLLDGTIWDWPSANEEVDIIGFASIVLQEGQRYLAFINPYSLDGRFIAIINDDRSITATISLGNYFREYDGYTVEQMMEIAEEYLVTGYTPEWWGNREPCVVEPGSRVGIEGYDDMLDEAWDLELERLDNVEPGSHVEIEGYDDILDEAWDLGLD